MLPSRVTEFCRSFLEDRGAKELWVACSGGLDSMALLELVREFADQHRVLLGVVHFNHNLRPGAREDELFVARRAARCGLPLVIGQGRNLAARARRHVSLETAARNARYAFFRRFLAARQKALLLTAHQADDQVETVLMNLMRGTGLRGLKGIPARRGRIGRPLLQTTRAELEAFVRQRNLAWREDESNASVLFLRNRVRSELLPVIRRLGGTGVEKRIASACGRLAADLELIDRQLAPYLAGMTADRGSLRFRRELFAELPPALRPHLLGAMIRRAGGRSQVPARVLDQLVRLAVGPRECRYDLGAGLVFRAGPETVCIGRPEAAEDAAGIPAYELEISAFGSCELPHELGRMAIVPQSEESPPERNPGGYGLRLAELVDGDRLIFPLTVRNRRPGDRFAPLGLAAGRRKLKKFFQEQALSRLQRAAWPLLVNGDGEIIWVAGLRLGHGFRLRPETRLRVRLDFKPGPGLDFPLPGIGKRE
jgi:tRNA(Ile)-lysidine synthase